MNAPADHMAARKLIVFQTSAVTLDDAAPPASTWRPCSGRGTGMSNPASFRGLPCNARSKRRSATAAVFDIYRCAERATSAAWPATRAIALHRILFGPRVLVRCLGAPARLVPFFDGRLPMPFIVWPNGLTVRHHSGRRQCWPRAAAQAGIPIFPPVAPPFWFSGNRAGPPGSIEESPGPDDGEWWFTLFMYESRDFAASAAGPRA